MGVCCSKTAKETGASSPRHYVSISGSPSSFPTENECKQDSALARGIEKTRSRLEKAVKTASVVDFNEKSSRSVFIVDPAWEAKHRPGEKKDSWENLVHKPRSNGQRSEQSSTENEDGDNKVILLKPRCSGAMRRLKKKDSKRQPNYKDEIMLTDNIDSIVEREIPEVPDYARSLAESPGPGCSHAGITRPSSRRSKKKNVNKLARSNEPNAKSTTASIAGAIPGPKEIYAKKRSGKACDKTLLKKEDIEERDLKRTPLAISSVSTSQLDKNCARGGTMEEEDIRMLKEVKNILKDDCLNFANKQTTASAGKAPKLTGKGSSKKEIYVKPSEEVVEEADVQAPTATSSSQMLRDSLQNLSTEVRQLNNGKHPTNRVNCVLKDVVPAAEIKGEFSAGRVSPPKIRQRPKQNCTMQKEMTEEEKLAADIEYILNDDIPATESNGQNSNGKVPPPTNRQRPKQNSTMQMEMTEEEKLAADIEYILNDDIPATESNGQNSTGKVPPPTKRQRPKENSTMQMEMTEEEKLAADIEYILNDDIPATESNGQNSTGKVPPPKNRQRPKQNSTMQKEMTEEEQLAADIEYILNDDIPATESNGQNSTGKVPPPKNRQRPKQNSTMQMEMTEEEKLAADIEYILNDDIPATESNGQNSTGKVSPPKNRQRPKENSTMQKEMTEAEQLAADIEYILNDDIPATESNGQNSTGKVPPPKNRQRPKENSTMQKEITEEEKLEDDIEYIWNDIPAVESSGINGQVTAGTVSPKEKAQEAKKKSLRENNLIVDKNIAKDVKDNIPVAEEVKTPLSPRKVLPKNKKTEKEKKRLPFQELEQAEDNLAKVVKDGSNEKVISGFGALPPPTKGFTRKHSKHADEQLAKDIEHILHEDDIFAVEPEVAIPYSPSETPRPKTRNPKRLLAMEMDRIFDPESIDCSPLAEDRETVDGMSNATMSTGAAPRPRNKTRRRKLKYMTIVEGVSEETDSNASVISACLAPPLQNSLSLSSGTEKHQRAHSTRKKETTEDKAVSEDRDQTLKGHLHTCKSLQPISSSSGLLPRPPKTRNPKRMYANNNQSSSPAASSSRTVILPKQDSLRKPKQEPQKDVASNGSNASSVRAGTRLRKKHPTRQPKERDETTLEIPTRGSGASVENHTDVAASIKKKNSSTQSNNARHIEEFNLDEAIEESLGIPATDTGASVENRTDVAANLKEKNSTAQPSKSKHTEEIDLNEAIKEILGISILGGDSKQAAEPNSMRKERKTDSRKKVTGQLHCMDTKKPAVQTASVPDIGFPDSKASSLGVETMNCDSGCSVASGDTMRPMAAGSSSVKTLGGSASSKTVKLPSSHISRKHSWKGKQTLPAILLKDETIVRKPRMRASRETAEPSLGGLQGMETHRNAAVPVTDGNNIGISSGIFYEPQELELMKQIERQSRCC